MAVYFSKRKLRPSEEEEVGELNIVPYLDVLMNLIIFMLLSMTGLATFGILNVSAPSYGGASASAGENEPSKVLLTVAISNKGFYVASTGVVLGEGTQANPVVPGQGEPTVPKMPDGSYDFVALNKKMAELKAAVPNETKVVIAAQNEIEYETLIGAMDACRETDGNTGKPNLFPDVTLGAF